MSLVSWVLVAAVVGFMLGFLIEWKILQSKIIKISEAWENKANRYALSKARDQKKIKRLETHLMAATKKINIVEDKSAQILKTTKFHGKNYKDVIEELSIKNRKAKERVRELSIINRELDKECVFIRDKATETRKQEKNSTQILADLQSFKEGKQEEIHAIRSETEQIISEHETTVSELQNTLKKEHKQLATLQRQVSDLSADNQTSETELHELTDQYRRLADEYESFKKEASDNENHAKAMLKESSDQLVVLNAKLTTNKQSKRIDAPTPSKPAVSKLVKKQKPTLRILNAGQPASSLSESSQASTTQSTQPDDLQRIKGIGPKIETKLNEHGLFSFSDLARLNEIQVSEIEEKLKFKGRVSRDNWIQQAKLLAKET